VRLNLGNDRRRGRRRYISVFQNFREEALGDFGLGGGEEFLGGRLFEDLAFGEKGDLVGDGAGEVHGMRDEDEGAAFGF